ncbi:MAG: GNVR domain-containing protein [Pseudomonadota bacterium]|nr:GNVR domain-containing protein [Pseudomonadota bacterium]
MIAEDPFVTKVHGSIPSDHAEPGVHEPFVKETFRILFSHIRVIVGMAIGFIAVALAIAALADEVWEVDAKVVVLSKRLSQLGDSTGGPMARYFPPDLQDLETERNILMASGLLGATVTELYDAGLLTEKASAAALWMQELKHSLRAMLPVDSDVEGPAAQRKAELEQWIEVFRDAVQSQILPGSNIIQLTIQYSNPNTAQEFLNRHLANYLELRRQLLLEKIDPNSAQQRTAWFEARFSRLESEKLAVLARYGSSDVDRELTFSLDQLFDEKQTRNRLESALLETTRSDDVETMRRQISLHESRIENLEKRIAELNVAETRLIRLDTEIEATREAYMAYVRHSEEAQSLAAAERENFANVKAVEPAVIPPKPVFPQWSMLLPVAGITGLLLGVLSAYLLEFTGQTVATKEQLARLLGLPVIAVIDDAR